VKRVHKCKQSLLYIYRLAVGILDLSVIKLAPWRNKAFETLIVSVARLVQNLLRCGPDVLVHCQGSYPQSQPGVMTIMLQNGELAMRAIENIHVDRPSGSWRFIILSRNLSIHI